MSSVPGPQIVVALRNSIPTPSLLTILFEPFSTILRPSHSELKRHLSFPIPVMVAFSSVRVFVAGSYFTLPVTPLIPERSLQFFSHTL